MKSDEIRNKIQEIVNRLLNQKGHASVPLNAETPLLGGGLPMDSLDLAVLITELQVGFGVDPFKSGFRNFQTVGELADLYGSAFSEQR